MNTILRFLSKETAFALIFFYSIFGFSQNESYINNEAMMTLNQMASKGSSTNNLSGVDMFRGKVNTTIPIHNHKGREISLPISLGYVAGGIKVDQVANNVGLGWQLHVGGRIERVAAKVADDNIYPSTETLYCKREHYTQPKNRDFYTVSAPGLEDIFKYASLQEGFKSLKNPKHIIKRTDSVGLESWRGNGEYVITAADGTKYYFGQNDAREKIYSSYNTGLNSPCSPIQVESTTAMMLTKIVSKNGLDEYIFNYKAFEWSTAVTSGGEAYSFENVATQQTEYLLQGYSYRLRQQGLTSIYHNNEKIIGFEYDYNRQDLNFVNSEGFKLSKILFYNFKNTTPFKTANFNYTYFGVPPPPVNPGNPGFEQRRLKLDSLIFYGFEGTTPIAGDTYGFSYISPEQVPKLSSNARDLMGFFNGMTTNTSLLYSPAPNQYGSIRTHHFDKSIIGTLDKITYPTKGYTKFEYEQNALKGGFGHDVIPGAVYTTYDKQELAFASAGGAFFHCYNEDETAAHPSMGTVRLVDYPGNTTYPSSRGQCYLKGVKSTFLRLDASTGKDVIIDKSGDGVYMIQKVQNCDINNDYSLSCYPNMSYNPVRNFPQNAGCMRPISQIYNTPTSRSQPSDYIIGGHTNTANQTVNYSFAEYGTYQITVWAYSSGGPNENNLGATVDIYKFNPRTVTEPDRIVSRDITDCVVDGFRIKSITDFTENNVFATKKMYKYDGYMVDRLPEVNVLYSPGTNIRSSRGFANSEIIHYQRVYEIPVNAINEHNGYVEYLFKDFYNPQSAICDSRMSHYSITPFFYNNRDGEEVRLNYVEGHFDLIHHKNVYDKNEKLIKKESFTYEDIEFDLGAYETFGPDNGPEVHKFTYLKKNNTKDYTENGEIEKNIHFGYYDFRIAGKTLSGSDENPLESVGYTHNHENINSPAMQGQITLIEDWKNENKQLLYANFGGKYLLSEVQTAFEGQPYQTQLKYEYDSDGNPVTLIRMSPGTQTPISYETTIWGYNNQFPIAKIIGKKYSDIPSGTINNIKAASNVAITAASETNLRTLLNALRTSYTDCQVTTSTYNPVFGVTSTTDAKNYELYYEYDALGRLRFTKEKNNLGNIVILSETNYNNRSN